MDKPIFKHDIIESIVAQPSTTDFRLLFNRDTAEAVFFYRNHWTKKHDMVNGIEWINDYSSLESFCSNLNIDLQASKRMYN